MMAQDAGDDRFRLAIEHGDADAVAAALLASPERANRTIHWYLNQPNESDPLHYVCDCVCNGTLTNGSEGEIAKLLIGSGARVDGTPGRESPLIAAASLGVPRVARVLVDAGANLRATAVFGAGALHWAAWTGAAEVVKLLIAHGAELEEKCAEFGATPLFWAAHGYSPQGPAEKSGQVECARALIEAGAVIETSNKAGESLFEVAKRCAARDLYDLLCRSR